MSPNNVLHFIESGGLYGAESVILNLSREMKKTGDYEPIVGCIVSNPCDQSDLYDKALKFGLKAEKLVIRNSRLLVDIPRISKQLQRINISIIHSHGYKPSVFGLIASVLTGIKITSTCHLWFLQGKLPLKMMFMIRMEVFFYRFFSKVVAVSDPIKDVLIKNGIAKSKIEIIKNGIIIDDYQLIDSDKIEKLRDEFGINAGELCLLNIARLSKQKAQWHIISAAYKLKAKGEKLQFLIVGDGALRDELLRKIDELDLKDNVKLIGFRQDIKELLQLADIFILPSLDEGMPIALLEAIASNTPVLATAVGDIPKLIKNGCNGVLVRVDDSEDLANGIQSLVASRALRERLSKRALADLCLEYSSKKMYERYSRIYKLVSG